VLAKPDHQPATRAEYGCPVENASEVSFKGSQYLRRERVVEVSGDGNSSFEESAMARLMLLRL
jgi:hypothetical protein